MRKQLFQSMRTEKGSNFFEQARLEHEIQTFLTKAMARYKEFGALLDDEELTYFSNFKVSIPLSWPVRLLLFKSRFVRKRRLLSHRTWALRYPLTVAASLLVIFLVGREWLIYQKANPGNQPEALITPPAERGMTTLAPKEFPPSLSPVAIPDTVIPPAPATPEKPTETIPADAQPAQRPATPAAPSRIDLGAGYYAVSAEGKWGLQNPAGKLVLPARYDLIKRFGPGDAFFRIEVNHLAGIANTLGEIVIHPFFEDVAQYFPNADLFVVAQDGRQRVYDRRRQRFVPGLDFPEISCFSEGRFCVQLDNGRWTFVDVLGHPVVSDTYDAILQPFRQGRARVRLNGQEVYIDQAGEEVALAE